MCGEDDTYIGESSHGFGRGDDTSIGEDDGVCGGGDGDSGDEGGVVMVAVF